MTLRTGQFSFSKLNQRGATLIEYVLLLVLAVALVKLLSTAFSNPMGKFLNAYMGTYIQCLLEFGELPSLGGESTTGGECNARFQPATLANGRPPKSESESSNRQSEQRSKDEGSEEEIRQANRTGNRGGASGSSGRGRIGDSLGADGGGEAKKTVVIDLNEEAGSKFFTPSRGGGARSQTATRADRISRYYLTETEVQELERSQSRRSAAPLFEMTPVAQKNKKYTVEPPPQRTIASQGEDSFSFGHIIRWIIIALMILFVLIFLGGLLSQFSRASRKSN